MEEEVKKKKFDKKILLIILLVIILGVMIYFYNTDTTSSVNNAKTASTNSTSTSSSTTTTEATVETKTIEKTISSSGEISAAVDEKLPLHATYYYSEVYYSEGDYVEAGANILKYTNGTYLTAPYNLVIKSLSLPSVNGQCTNSNYIEVNSLDTLTITLSVSEDDLSEVKVGQEVNIELSTDSSKKYTGYITKIGNSGTYSSKGTTYEAEVTFENDGNIKIGMSGDANIILDKVENVLAVPSEAVTTTNGKSYVTKVENGNTTQVEVTIGLDNDAYVEIKSGLSQGDTVQVQESTTTNSGMPGGGVMMQNQQRSSSSSSNSGTNGKTTSNTTSK